MSDNVDNKDGSGRVQMLINAEEAYPALERLVLNAEREVIMGFRVFDPRTKLRSPEALEIGNTWVDLIIHALRKGVRIKLWLSDFDAAAATELHRATWETVRILCGVREMAGPKGTLLTVHPRLHPARPGRLARLFLSPLIAGRLNSVARTAVKEARTGDGRGLKMLPGISAMRRHRFGQGMPTWPVSHHQKLATIDGRWLYIGGLDLDERRWDTHTHNQPSHLTWHDLQLLIDDETLAASARAHLENFDDVTEARADPVKAPDLLRTISAKRRKSHMLRISPKKVLRQLEARHYARIAEATHLVYLETQFFRDKGLAKALADRAHAMAGLKLILVVPGAPETSAFEDPPKLDGRYGDHLQLQCLQIVRNAFGPKRLLVASPVQPRTPNEEDCPAPRATLAGAPIIYLHSKLSVFDGRAAIVSSANLNGRSLRWDTETGVELVGSPVDLIRRRMQQFWLGDSSVELFPLQDAFEHWTKAVEANAGLPPAERKGFLVPYDSDAARYQAVNLPGVPVEMV
ncbi:phospholipase D family protein [Pseudoroseicyclus tamaricis]|uniref:Phospholipase D n=1 Tax=Pseudoroseicyclus tamaricis TaxID=2705421 RepID=A0A6B2K458_9RHOB|nr:phospholipase D-like domain-containing protein [Pseudoroseicyclus tamaricis]NDV01446.1 phospholipase [Pseudoroseicyclus tamaricis]